MHKSQHDAVIRCSVLSLWLARWQNKKGPQPASLRQSVRVLKMIRRLIGFDRYSTKATRLAANSKGAEIKS